MSPTRQLEKLVLFTIGDVMSRKVVTVTEGEMVLQTVKKMHEARVGSVIVTGKGQAVAGIFTERDLMSRVVAPEKDPKKTPVSEVMTKDPETLASGMPILTAFQLLHSSGFRHVPIVDDSKLVGILSGRDLHKLVYQFLEIAVLER